MAALLRERAATAVPGAHLVSADLVDGLLPGGGIVDTSRGGRRRHLPNNHRCDLDVEPGYMLISSPAVHERLHRAFSDRADRVVGSVELLLHVGAGGVLWFLERDGEVIAAESGPACRRRRPTPSSPGRASQGWIGMVAQLLAAG